MLLFLYVLRWDHFHTNMRWINKCVLIWCMCLLCNVSYSDVIASQLHVSDSVAMAGVATGEAAVLAHSGLLGFTVVQPVLVVLRAGPGLQRFRLHQKVPKGWARLLQVCLDVGLAAWGVATQADLHCREWWASAAQDALQRRRGGLLHTQGVVLLDYVGQFVVLLQAGLLRVSMIALRAASQRGVFGPGLADAAPTEVVLAGQLDGIWEHVQADGADELLLETVPPCLSHVRGHHGAGRHTLTVFHRPLRPSHTHTHSLSQYESRKEDKNRPKAVSLTDDEYCLLLQHEGKFQN